MSPVTTAVPRMAGCGLAVALALSLGGCGAAEPSDAALAYCLAPAQQSKFVDAAVALQVAARGRAAGTLASPTGDVPIAEWRNQTTAEGKSNSAAFARVCDAIRPADPPDDLKNAAVALGNVVAGAFVALLAGSWTARLARRRQVSDALREAARRFVRATDSLVAKHTNQADQGLSEADVLDRVSVLESVLLRTRSLRRRPRPYVTAVLKKLDDLTPILFARWPDSPTAREQRGVDLAANARALQGQVEDLATTLDHAWWRRQPSVPA